MRVRSLGPSLLFPLLLLFLGGCADATGAAERRLVVTGSSTVAPLAAEIARRFEAERPGVRIDVQTGGSSKGIHDAREGLSDIGMASRALEADEGGVVHAYAIAQDGIALIVHASNPVTTLSDDQVRALYRGEVERWDAVGGPSGRVTVINKASGRATLAVFLAHFGLDEGEVEADVVIGDNQAGIKTVAGDPLAVGYVSIGAAEYAVEAGTPIRPLPAGGVAATTANVGAGTFPISRPLNLVTNGEATGLAREFIDYCRSPTVHDIVEDLYFVPVAVGP